MSDKKRICSSASKSKDIDNCWVHFSQNYTPRRFLEALNDWYSIELSTLMRQAMFFPTVTRVLYKGVSISVSRKYLYSLDTEPLIELRLSSFPFCSLRLPSVGFQSEAELFVFMMSKKYCTYCGFLTDDNWLKQCTIAARAELKYPCCNTCLADYVMKVPKDDYCPVCLDPIDRDLATQFSCGHFLHRLCLNEYVLSEYDGCPCANGHDKIHVSCPICRKNIDISHKYPYISSIN